MSATLPRPLTAVFLAVLVLSVLSNCPGLGPRKWESNASTAGVSR